VKWVLGAITPIYKLLRYADREKMQQFQVLYQHHVEAHKIYLNVSVDVTITAITDLFM
jgi:hypothetical protein